MAIPARAALVTTETSLGAAAETVASLLGIEYARPLHIAARAALVTAELNYNGAAEVVASQFLIEYLRGPVTPVGPAGCPLGPGAAPVQGADGCANGTNF